MANSLDIVVQEASAEFQRRFFEKPTVCAYAAGRVNLIGEHVDYNDGFVMPMAIPLYTVVVGVPLDIGNRCEIFSTSIKDGQNFAAFNINSLEVMLTNENAKWTTYVLGIISLFPGKFGPFRAVIHSTVPLGGGLSSSASLETAFFRFLDAIATQKSNFSNKDVALLCQKAEHIYANVPCGVMDQFCCAFATKNNAILLDCRNLACEHLQFNDPNVVVLVTNSNVKHELNTSEYAERRRVCHETAKHLGVPSLRDVAMDTLENNKVSLSLVAFKRVKHVIKEIERTQEAAKALNSSDFATFGKLMVESHNSLKSDFEVSCPELDQLVNIALSCEGVYGTRMTGGGFGGCTVTLVEKDFVDNVINTIKERYSGTATFYLCTPVDGSNTKKL